MIKHTIDKHTPPKDEYHYNRPSTWPNFRQHSPEPLRYDGSITLLPRQPDTALHSRMNVSDTTLSSPNGMSKLEYAMFLRNLPIKVGDLVTSVFSRKPWHFRGVYRVDSIDEIHRYVEWGPANVGPLCLNLHSCLPGVTPHKGGAKMYQVVDPDDIPNEWRDYLKRDTNAHT